jgi:hypothetical protein
LSVLNVNSKASQLVYFPHCGKGKEKRLYDLGLVFFPLANEPPPKSYKTIKTYQQTTTSIDS